MYVPDNFDLFDRWDAEQEKKMEGLPVCDYCDAAITGHYYDFGDEIICPTCLDDYFRKEVDEW